VIRRFLLSLLLLSLTVACLAQSIGGGASISGGASLGFSTMALTGVNGTTVSFSPDPATYSSQQTVTLTPTTAGDSIFCTTDGSTPTIGTAECGTLSIASTTTINAVEANVGKLVGGTQASSSGWKPICTPNGNAASSTTDASVACGGVGTQQPSAVWQLYGVTSPSMDAKTMHLSVTTTAQVASYTMALFVWEAGACDTCTYLTSDFWIQPGENPAQMGNWEHDTYQFIASNSTQSVDAGWDFMYGFQCNNSEGKFQIDNQTEPWADTPIACSYQPGVWTHVVLKVHRVEGDTSCSGAPCEYFDSVTVNGTTTALNMTLPATPLNSGWSSQTGNQFQLDCKGIGATTSNPITCGEYIDESDFIATGPPSAVSSATYTIE